MEFKEVIKSRRSVRVYDKDPVPDEVVKECIDFALLAPSSSNLQPWEFHWVKTPEKKAKLVAACMSQPAAATAPVLIVCVARTKTWCRNRNLMLDLFSGKEDVPKFAVDYYKKLIPLAMVQGPFGVLGWVKKLIVTVIGWFRPTPRGPFGHQEVKLWATKSTALACENLMLSFRAAGYDSCPMEGFDEVRVKKLLNLPYDATVVMVISAGKRTDKGVYGPQIRFNRDLFVFEV